MTLRYDWKKMSLIRAPYVAKYRDLSQSESIIYVIWYNAEDSEVYKANLSKEKSKLYAAFSAALVVVFVLLQRFLTWDGRIIPWVFFLFLFPFIRVFLMNIVLLNTEMEKLEGCSQKYIRSVKGTTVWWWIWPILIWFLLKLFI